MTVEESGTQTALIVLPLGGLVLVAIVTMFATLLFQSGDLAVATYHLVLEALMWVTAALVAIAGGAGGV